MTPRRPRVLLPALAAPLALALGLTLGGAAVSAASAAAPAAAPSAAGSGAAAAPTPGSGWYLAAVDRSRRTADGVEPSGQRLVLISPDGERTPIFERDLPTPSTPAFRLADWSPDGSTALLLVQPPHRALRAIAVDVATGHTRRLVLPEDTGSAVLAPDGNGVLAESYPKESTKRASVSLVDWSGDVTRLQAPVAGPVLASTDGGLLVTGPLKPRGTVVRVLDASDGDVVRRIATPRPCLPVRWWDADRALVQCWTRSGRSSLSLVDVATGTTTRLSRNRGSDPGVITELDARRIRSGLYLEVGGPCGYVSLGRQRADGTVAHVRVPGAVGNVLLLGTRGDRLVIEHAASCDGDAPRAAIGIFNPVTHHERLLTMLPSDEDFARVLDFGERQPTAY